MHPPKPSQGGESKQDGKLIHPATDPRDPSILLAVSRLYYEEDYSKTKIAEMFKTNPTQVNRWLERARADGIVKVVYTPPLSALLSERLKGRYDCLRDAIVATIPGDLHFSVHLELLGRAAAEYFDRTILPGTKVGISGGSTMSAMIDALPHRNRDIRIFPTAIIGRGPHIGEHIDPMVTVTLLWVKSGRQPDTAHSATVPPYDDSVCWNNAPARRLEWLKNQKVGEVYDGMKTVDVLLASTGPLGADQEYYNATGPTVIKEVADLGATPEWLRAQGIIGDINYAFFDESGESQEDWEIFLTVPLRTLRDMSADEKRRVVLVAGRHKIHCIRGLLRGRLCSVLITDELTAQQLLQ